ncbi:eukaryotic translation initiation factor 3 subunit J [Centruroides vittatus]|uniref:eukaryotic translation initiation factor 3 subunit J-like n=1 Tax=Centruroides sculpturatus TaxID=218467 RepID=UPI000C6E2BA7|nr:eukaryotic translation initiation factor 3 subunit J-like [Centruroides sculpturatus]
MADESWDNEDYEPPAFTKPAISDRWEGEDEDDDIKENWYDEDTSEKAEEEKPTDKAVLPQQKKKRIQQIIAEKEEKKKEQLKVKELEKKELTPEEMLAEKLRQQKLQEDADLELAKEAFGTGDLLPEKSIESMVPSTKPEFDEFRKALVKKISQFEKSPQYVLFLDDLFRELCVNVDSEEIKKVTSSLNALANEKVKAQKTTKHKKKTKGKASLNLGKNADYELGNFEDEYEDFI